MPQVPINLTLLAVYPPRDGDPPRLIARVQFAFTHTGYDPVRIGRDYQDKEGGAWKFFETASIPTGSCLAIRDAKVVQGPEGPFLSGPFRGVPQSVRDEIVALAIDKLQSCSTKQHLQPEESMPETPF